MKVEVIRFDDEGQGIARINNKVCFIKKALPKEIVDIEIVKDTKNYSKAIIKKIIKPSSTRIEPLCKLAPFCGGCDFEHLEFTMEKQFKIEKALNYFSKCDAFYSTVADGYHYRNKVTLHAKNGKIGFYQEKSHHLLDVDYCYLLDANINEVIKILKKLKIPNFPLEILIRSNQKGEIIVAIKGEYPDLSKLKVEKKISNLIYNDKIIKGHDYLIEEVANYKFKVHYQSFFQVNLNGLKQIYQILEHFLKKQKIIKALDLYSGTSVLGIFLSKYVKEVISIEENKKATDDAKDNIILNNLHNLKIINGKVEDNIDKFQNIDLILVDPARRGLDKKTLNYLKIIKPKYIIYIACEMISLKRDLTYFFDSYQLENLYLVDMFPRTSKVETIAILNQKEEK